MQVERAFKHVVNTCPVCGARRFRYLFSMADHRLVRCTDCHFTLLNPQPSDEERVAIHAQTHSAPLERRTAEACLDQLANYAGLRQGKLLEVGTGGGTMLSAAARRGFQVTAVEYAEHLCTAARRHLDQEGLDAEILYGEVDALATRIGEFDACVIVDAIEHARDPRLFLQLVHQLLRPGGVILIVTPSLDSPDRWRELKPKHLSYFGRKTLESLLFAEGFRTLAWQPGSTLRNPDREFPGFLETLRHSLPSALHAREHRLLASSMVIMGRRDEKPARPRLSIIMPVFNEAATFRDAFIRLLAHPFPAFDVEYLVVESNSTDGTRAIVNEFAATPDVRIILEDRPRGKGHAVRTGLAAATGDFIAIQDADLEYDLDDYDALLEPLLNNREAFVLGARHGGRAWKMRQFTGQPIASLLMNFGHWFFTTLLNVCFLVRLRDPFTMYKLFRRDCIHGLPFECNRFDFDWELVIKLIRRGYTPIEIPVNYRSRSFKEGKKVSVIRDPLTWLRAVVRFRFARLPRWAEPVQQPTPQPAESSLAR